MTIAWSEFQLGLDELIKTSGDRTDNRLAGKIAIITRLTDEEIKVLFPDPGDVKRLANLMEVVKGAGAKNEKINRIVANSEEFGGIILTLLAKFA